MRLPFGKAHLPADHVVYAVADAAEQQRKTSHMRNLEWWVQTPGSTGGAVDGQTLVSCVLVMCACVCVNVCDVCIYVHVGPPSSLGVVEAQESGFKKRKA